MLSSSGAGGLEIVHRMRRQGRPTPSVSSKREIWVKISNCIGSEDPRAEVLQADTMRTDYAFLAGRENYPGLFPIYL